MTKTIRCSSLMLLIAAVGFAQTAFPQSQPLGSASADSTCSLLPATVVAKAQGAQFVTVKSFERDNGYFNTATCYYRLEPEYQSVSLEVISRSKSGAGNAAELWREKFHGE